MVLEQVPDGLGQREHAHAVPALVGVEGARIDESLSGECLEVVVQTIQVAPVASFAQLAVEDQMERADRLESVTLGVAKAIAAVAAPDRLAVHS